MTKRKTVIAICGSTRTQSTNHILIEIIREMSADRFDVIPSGSIADLPPFNPDLDNETPPLEVAAFRASLRAQDGIKA